jgi:hypothetical protein
MPREGTCGSQGARETPRSAQPDTASSVTG